MMGSWLRGTCQPPSPLPPHRSIVRRSSRQGAAGWRRKGEGAGRQGRQKHIPLRLSLLILYSFTLKSIKIDDVASRSISLSLSFFSSFSLSFQLSHQPAHYRAICTVPREKPVSRCAAGAVAACMLGWLVVVAWHGTSVATGRLGVG